MYFDPLSAWFVALMAGGVIASGEKFGGRSAQKTYDRERIEQGNRWLNGDIRRVKDKYGLDLPEMAYKQIQLHISVTKDSFAFKYAHGGIVIDLDNQEYIIALLEECAKYYSKYESVQEYCQKAEWYKTAATEARRRKELYAKELEEARLREAKQREKNQTMSNIYLVTGLIIIVAFIVLVFS